MLYSIASWFALLVGAAALTRYYNPELFNKILGLAPSRLVANGGPPEPAAKKQKSKRTHTTRLDASNSGASTPTSAAEGAAKKKRKLAPVPAPAAPSTYTVAVQDDEAEVSNREFAQQLAKAQSGTKLEPAKTPGQSKKDRRAAAKEATANHPVPEAPEPAVDADDDLSPVGSPSTAATEPVSTAPTSREGDVSDMLEAPESKPMTMRLTGIKSVVSTTKKAASKAFEPVLSKKQRQRKAKQAEEKAMREESDRLHEAKKQQQMRTARMAEGSSNQTKANSFAATKANAWQAPTVPQENAVKASVEHQPLLDTFEKVNATTRNGNTTGSVQPLGQITNKDHPKSSNTKPPFASKASWADEVNADEQDKWEAELTGDAQWESVTSKKGKKKTKKDNETGSETSSQAARPEAATPPAVSMPSTNGAKANGVSKTPAASNRFQMIDEPVDSSFKDAEWEA